MKKGWAGVSPEWLKKKKEAHGVSYFKMQVITGIDRTNLHKYTIGINNMSNETKKKIYNAFKLYENG